MAAFKATSAQERVIMGIDPGTKAMGYGIVRLCSQHLEILQLGVIHLSKYAHQAQKLHTIWEGLHQLVEDFAPDEVALEAPFYGKNIQSTLKLGRAQGVAMAVALSKGIPIVEYAPRKVKQAITGNGNASKEQVATMLRRQFSLEELPSLLDATDALAVAVCHAWQRQAPARGKAKNWASFIAAHPERVKQS